MDVPSEPSFDCQDVRLRGPTRVAVHLRPALATSRKDSSRRCPEVELIADVAKPSAHQCDVLTGLHGESLTPHRRVHIGANVVTDLDVVLVEELVAEAKLTIMVDLDSCHLR